MEQCVVFTIIIIYYATTFVIKNQLTRRQQMNLGTGFLKFGGGPSGEVSMVTL